MSLKAFHIVFITASILLTFGFAAWLINNFVQSGSVLQLIFGIVSGLVGVSLAFYGKYFLRKLKHVGYI